MSFNATMQSLLVYVEDAKGIRPHARRTLTVMLEMLQAELEKERQHRFNKMMAASARLRGHTNEEHRHTYRGSGCGIEHVVEPGSELHRSL